MAEQILNVGTAANDDTGDLLRDAMIKIKDNTHELYTDKSNKTLDFIPSGAYTGITTQQGFDVKTQEFKTAQDLLNLSQETYNKQLVTYPASFVTSTSLAGFCKTEGYNGYNLVFALINTGTPPTINIYGIDRNYLLLATVTMPVGCTNITACMFYGGTLYIAGGTATSSGMYRMTFASGSTIAAPTFDVSALITTDGTTSIPNTSLGYAMNTVTIGAETRMLILYKASNIITYSSSYNVTSTGVNFGRVDATSGHGSFTVGTSNNNSVIHVLSGGTNYILTGSAGSFYYGIYKFVISITFEVTFPSTNTGYYYTTGYKTLNLAADSNYIYSTVASSGNTTLAVIRTTIANVILGGSISVEPNDIVYTNYYNSQNSGLLFIKNNILVVSTNTASSPFSKWINYINLTTFKRILFIEDGAYSAASNNLGLLISQRSSNGVNFEEINHYVSLSLATGGFCNVFKTYNF